MRRIIACLVYVLALPAAGLAATLTAHLTANEQARYDKMARTDPVHAKAYHITREFVDLCRQVIADNKLALVLPVQPERFDRKYVTADEQDMVDQAVDLNVAALIVAGGVTFEPGR